jgi:hypothetical protein
MGSGLRLGSRQSRDRAHQQYGSDNFTVSSVGPDELKPIAESGFRVFPPPLPEQPEGRFTRKYWIPAGDSEEFSKNVMGPIEVVAECRMDQAKNQEHC